MRVKAIIVSLVLTWGYGSAAYAFEAAGGEFLAKKSCAAVQSIKKGGNPGRVKLRVDERYPVTGLNKPNGTYVQLKVAGARPESRWVKRNCGTLNPGPVEPVVEQYVLALSWQPAFCETKPDKTECKTQTSGRFDADHFALHGLWPQPKGNVFCGVSADDRSHAEQGKWDKLPDPDLSAETRARLSEAMPGTASNLQRHEFTKHGTCFPGNADLYFRVSLALLEQINVSRLRDLMATHIGATVSSEDIKGEFEQDFGAGAGAALDVHCVDDQNSHRTLISEIRVNLKGTLMQATKLQDVLDHSTRGAGDCSKGIVDPVGLN
ncbi:MAG TPA: ribonuclease T2 [Patescibacteria group bacterium]|nr:ribonuclease T2 [Patescibacteria group bacterium]